MGLHVTLLIGFLLLLSGSAWAQTASPTPTARVWTDSDGLPWAPEQIRATFLNLPPLTDAQMDALDLDFGSRMNGETFVCLDCVSDATLTCWTSPELVYYWNGWHCI